MRGRAMIAIGAAALMVLAACGDDDDDSAASDATAAPTDAPTVITVDTPADTTVAASGGSVTEGSAAPANDLCALATTMDEQESLPTKEQLEQYKSLAPGEIAESVKVAADAIIAAGDDVVAQFNALAADDVEAAVLEINAYETEHCGIDHSDDAVPEGASRDIEDAATRVDVTATDFAFDVPTVQAGRTSFVLNNDGEEAHILVIFKLADGVTLEDAMASDTGEGIEGQWATGFAASGGDEEAITFDVEPGTYGMVCFLPTTDGTPHFMLGMQNEFTVA
jgi:plastocyanin